jgi:phospholipid-binding lipoprotein MlaA
MRLRIGCIALLMLAGCATTPGEERLAERDPLEGFNRGVWGFNRVLDVVAIKPVTAVYRTAAPRPARRGISRIFANLSEPFSMINNILQGKPDRAMRNLERFAINTTIGVGGLADHATGMGIAPANEDFGQTLARWGVNGGPYLVLPVLGPSTLRDGVGSGVSQIADPYRVGVRNIGLTNTQQYGLLAGEIINTRSDLMESGADTFLKTSLDPYAAARSAFLQRRHAEIRDEEDGGADSAADATPDAETTDTPEAPVEAPPAQQ